MVIASLMKQAARAMSGKANQASENAGKQPPVHRRVLVVDDEKDIRDVFLQVISYGLPNCRVDLAVNGAEAVEAFRSIDYSVLVMDLKMPVMDGERAFQEIQKICLAENRHMPSIIFCTGYDVSGRIHEMVSRNPAHCLLKKPISGDQLLRHLESRLPPS